MALALAPRAEFHRDVAIARSFLRPTHAIPYLESRWMMDVRSARCRILIVDDSEEIVSILAAELARAGHLVTTATDGVQALAVAEQARPQLALVDLRLPRLNGWEVGRRLRARFGSSILLTALTGWSTPGDRDRSKQAGFDRHLTKPASLREIRALIDAAMAENSKAPQVRGLGGDKGDRTPDL